MKQREGRTELDLQVVRDGSLSLKARGIYALIQYLQQNNGIEWPTIAELTEFSRDGRCSLSSGLNELKKAGLIPFKPLHPQNRKPGYIYLFFSSDWDLYKIGLSADIDFRLASLKKKHNISIVIVDSIPSLDMGLDEALIHMRYAARRVKGEWFDLSDLDPMNVLRGES